MSLNIRPRDQIAIAVEFDSGFVNSAQVFYMPDDLETYFSLLK